MKININSFRRVCQWPGGNVLSKYINVSRRPNQFLIASELFENSKRNIFQMHCVNKITGNGYKVRLLPHFV